jgi:hypothetical protein
VRKLQFFILNRACGKSLDTFYIEPQQTLSLLAALELFLDSMENKTAFPFQTDREKRARTDYRRKRRDLLRLVLPERKHLLN